MLLSLQSDKHSSLFVLRVSDKEKKVYNIGTRSLTCHRSVVLILVADCWTLIQNELIWLINWSWSTRDFISPVRRSLARDSGLWRP